MRAPARRLTTAATAIAMTIGMATVAASAHAAATATVFPSVGSSQLNISGDAGAGKNDQISVRYDAADGKYVVSATDEAGGGVTPGAAAPGEPNSHCVQATPNQVVCDRITLSGTFLVRIDGLTGNDTLAAGYGDLPWHPTDHSRLDGGAGNDRLGGSPQHDTLIGGGDNDGIDGAAGDDSLIGGVSLSGAAAPGADRLFGGPGSDDLLDSDGTGSANADELDGGVCPVTVTPCAGTGVEGADDQDFVDYFDRTAGVVVNLGLETGNGESGENDKLRNLEGAFTGDGADTLTGNARENGFFAGDGNDTINVAGDPGNIDTADCDDGTDSATIDADDVANDCETTSGAGGGGTTGGGGGTTGGGGGTTSGGGGTTGGSGQPPAAAPDTTGPAIVSTGNSTLTAAANGGFGFGLGPFAEDTTGTVAIKSAPVSASRAGAAAKKVVLNLGRKSFTAAAGKKVSVRFKLSAKHRTILAKRKKIRMTATIVARDKAGNASTKKVSFTLKAPKRKR